MAKTVITFTDNLDEVLSAVKSAKAMALTKIGAACQNYAKDNTPVRTGTLRDSFGVEVHPDDDCVLIGTLVSKFPDKPYGQYVELGARGRKPVKMLTRAATEHTDEYKKLAKQAFENA